MPLLLSVVLFVGSIIIYIYIADILTKPIAVVIWFGPQRTCSFNPRDDGPTGTRTEHQSLSSKADPGRFAESVQHVIQRP